MVVPILQTRKLVEVTGNPLEVASPAVILGVGLASGGQGFGDCTKALALSVPEVVLNHGPHSLPPLGLGSPAGCSSEQERPHETPTFSCSWDRPLPPQSRPGARQGLGPPHLPLLALSLDTRGRPGQQRAAPHWLRPFTPTWLSGPPVGRGPQGREEAVVDGHLRGRLLPGGRWEDPVDTAAARLQVRHQVRVWVQGCLGAGSDTLGRVQGGPRAQPQLGERPSGPRLPGRTQVGHWGRPRAAGALAGSRALWPPRPAAA